MILKKTTLLVFKNMKTCFTEKCLKPCQVTNCSLKKAQLKDLLQGLCIPQTKLHENL